MELRPRPVAIQHPQAVTREVDNHVLPAVTVEIGGGQVRGIEWVQLGPLVIVPVIQPQTLAREVEHPGLDLAVAVEIDAHHRRRTVRVELEPELVAVALLHPEPQADSRSEVDDQAVWSPSSYS